MSVSPELVERARQFLGDTGEPEDWIWSNTQIEEFVAAGYSEYSYGVRDSTSLLVDDHTQGLKLARSYALYELATNTALFFKWRDQQKDVDRSMTPEMCRRIGKDLWEQVMRHRESMAVVVGIGGRNVPQGGILQMNPGKTASDRTVERPWK